VEEGEWGERERERERKKKTMENNRGRGWKSGKNLERCPGKGWKWRLLDLFHGGHMLRNGGTGTDLTPYLIHKLWMYNLCIELTANKYEKNVYLAYYTLQIVNTILTHDPISALNIWLFHKNPQCNRPAISVYLNDKQHFTVLYCALWNETLYHLMYFMLPKSVCISA